MNGIVDVGGGLRGAYAAGILDRCMEDGVCFDCCIGVSAGTSNLIDYLSGQKERSRRFYLDYAFRKEYMGLRQLRETGSYLNFDYIYHTLGGEGGEDPLDYDAYEAHPARFIMVATDARTGAPRYFERADLSRDNYGPMMASCCVPGIDRPVELDGVPYYDGALGDPVPLEKAFASGCDRVVLILTKPAAVPRTQGKDKLLAGLIRRRYPAAAEQLLLRAEHYNAAVERAKAYEREGRVLLLSPDDISGLGTLKRNRPALERIYEKGFRDGAKVRPWLERGGAAGNPRQNG